MSVWVVNIVQDWFARLPLLMRERQSLSSSGLGYIKSRAFHARLPSPPGVRQVRQIGLRSPPSPPVQVRQVRQVRQPQSSSVQRSGFSVPRPESFVQCPAVLVLSCACVRPGSRSPDFCAQVPAFCDQDHAPCLQLQSR
eukprot:gene13921-biopygen10006